MAVSWYLGDVSMNPPSGKTCVALGHLAAGSVCLREPLRSAWGQQVLRPAGQRFFTCQSGQLDAQSCRARLHPYRSLACLVVSVSSSDSASAVSPCTLSVLASCLDTVVWFIPAKDFYVFLEN